MKKKFENRNLTIDTHSKGENRGSIISKQFSPLKKKKKKSSKQKRKRLKLDTDG